MNQDNKKIITGLIILVVVVLIVVGVKAFMPAGSDTKDSSSVVSTTTRSSGTSSGTSDENTSPANSDADYKDGTYTATGSYESPGGTESVKVTLSVVSNKVTNSEIVSLAKTPEAKEFQGQFIAGYKTLVVGKNVDDIRLSRVSGSSLTSGGFNDALNEIKSKAKS